MKAAFAIQNRRNFFSQNYTETIWHSYTKELSKIFYTTNKKIIKIHIQNTKAKTIKYIKEQCK